MSIFKNLDKQKSLTSIAVTIFILTGVILSTGVANNKMLIETLNNENDSIEKELKLMQTEIKSNKENIDIINEVNKELMLELDRVEEENKELKSKNKDLEKQISMKANNAASNSSYARSNSNVKQSGTPVQMTLTFYGDGAEENGGYAGKNAYSNSLSAGMVASNVYPRGTKFVTPDGKILDVQDRGGKNFDSYNRLDVFVPRQSGESKSAYDKRISNLGKKTITLYKL